jgi:hypothetical protein
VRSALGCAAEVTGCTSRNTSSGTVAREPMVFARAGERHNAHRGMNSDAANVLVPISTSPVCKPARSDKPMYGRAFSLFYLENYHRHRQEAFTTARHDAGWPRGTHRKVSQALVGRGSRSQTGGFQPLWGPTVAAGEFGHFRREAIVWEGQKLGETASIAVTMWSAPPSIWGKVGLPEDQSSTLSACCS